MAGLQDLGPGRERSQGIDPRHHRRRAAARAFAVIAGGFLLMNLTFVIFAMYGTAFRARQSPDGETSQSDSHVVRTFEFGGFLLVVALITMWVVLQWPDSLATAAWLCVPTASVLVTIGVAAHDALWVGFLTGGVLTIATVAILIRSRRPWEQVLAVSWVAAGLAVMTLLGVEL